MTVSDKEWLWVVEGVTAIGTTKVNNWEGIVISANFPFFRIRKEPSTKEEPETKHSEENSWNLEEDLEEGLFN